MAIGESLSKFFDVINKFLAFVVILAYVLFAINANWTFIPGDSVVMTVINMVMRYGPLAICGLVLVEFAIKRNLVIQIVIYALIALAVIFQFFPDTFHAMVNIVNGVA